MEYLFCYMPPTRERSGKKKANKAQQILVKTIFFVKTELQHI